MEERLSKYISDPYHVRLAGISSHEKSSGTGRRRKPLDFSWLSVVDPISIAPLVFIVIISKQCHTWRWFVYSKAIAAIGGVVNIYLRQKCHDTGALMPFKDRMKEIRNDSGLSQKQMSENLGVSLRTLQRYEEGSKVPDVESLVNLATSGYNLHWLITGDGNKYHWKKSIEDSYLKEISIWLDEEAEREVKIRDWFKIQFEIAFPTFKKWRAAKKKSSI